MKRHLILRFWAKRTACYLLLLSAGFVPLQLATPIGASNDVCLAGMFLATEACLIGFYLYLREKPKLSDATKIIIGTAALCYFLNGVMLN